MRYILLNEGDVIREGDEVLHWERRAWELVCPLWADGNHAASGSITRRKVDADLEPLLETLFKLQEERMAT